jgi:hypothetical protein
LRLGWQRYFGKLRHFPFDAPQVPPEQRRWAGPFRTVEPEAVNALVERCREKGFTLSHVLSAAMLLEIAERVRARDGARPFDLAMSTSLDLRRFGALPDPDARQMGLMVTVVQTYYRARAQDDLWTMAQRVKDSLDAVKARNEHRDFALAPNLFNPRTLKWLSNEPHGRTPEGLLLVSNFGRLEDLKHGAFSARRIFFTSAQAVFGGTFLLAVGTLHGRMFIHLGHPTPGISEATGAAVLDAALRRMGV